MIAVLRAAVAYAYAVGALAVLLGLRAHGTCGGFDVSAPEPTRWGRALYFAALWPFLAIGIAIVTVEERLDKTRKPRHTR